MSQSSHPTQSVGAQRPFHNTDGSAYMQISAADIQYHNPGKPVDKLLCPTSNVGVPGVYGKYITAQTNEEDLQTCGYSSKYIGQNNSLLCPNGTDKVVYNNAFVCVPQSEAKMDLYHETNHGCYGPRDTHVAHKKQITSNAQHPGSSTV